MEQFKIGDVVRLLTCSECGGPMPFGCDCPSCGRMTRAIGAYKPPIAASQAVSDPPASQGVTVTDDAEADVPTFVHSE